MRAVCLVLTFLFGTLANAGPCLKGDVNGSEIGGMVANKVYTLILEPPSRTGRGKLSVKLGNLEIASGDLYRESESLYGFEGTPGLIRADGAQGWLNLTINGGILNNAEGMLHILRKRGDSHIYSLRLEQNCR